MGDCAHCGNHNGAFAVVPGRYVCGYCYRLLTGTCPTCGAMSTDECKAYTDG